MAKFGFAVSCVLLAGVLLFTQRIDYAYMRVMLDTGMFLVSGTLAMLFRDIGHDVEGPFPRLLSITFAVTYLLALLHVLVGVGWPVVLFVISAPVLI